MDETLIRAEFKADRKSTWTPDYEFELNGQKVVVKERPFIRDVLQRLAEQFELCLFTAAMKDYAEKIL